MKDNSVEFNFKQLTKLVRYFKKGFPRVRVGIIGDKAAQEHKNTDGKLTNAQIGFIHEFGVMTGKNKIPARSFLDMPLRLHLQDYIDKSETLNGEAFEEALENGELEEYATQVGIVAERVVQDAFRTSGFGNWAPNRPSTILRKGSSKPLIDTGELRRSISSEVVDD